MIITLFTSSAKFDWNSKKYATCLIATLHGSNSQALVSSCYWNPCMGYLRS